MKPKLIVVVRGGVVQGFISDNPEAFSGFHIAVRDWDNVVRADDVSEDDEVARMDAEAWPVNSELAI